MWEDNQERENQQEGEIPLVEIGRRGSSQGRHKPWWDKNWKVSFGFDDFDQLSTYWTEVKETKYGWRRGVETKAWLQKADRGWRVADPQDWG